MKQLTILFIFFLTKSCNSQVKGATIYLSDDLMKVKINASNYNKEFKKIEYGEVYLFDSSLAKTIDFIYYPCFDTSESKYLDTTIQLKYEPSYSALVIRYFNDTSKYCFINEREGFGTPLLLSYFNDRSKILNLNFSNISILPNPATSYVSFYSDYLIPLKNIELYNSVGQKLLTNIKINKKVYTIDLSTFSAGTYYLTIRNSYGTIAIADRIILQK